MSQRLKTELRIQVPKIKASLMLHNLISHQEGRPPAPLPSGRCWKGSFWNTSNWLSGARLNNRRAC